MLDVFFLSYNELYADENYELLKIFAPHAKRVHGVKGIFEAHKECARRSNTSYFYVCDADCIIQEQFDFRFTPDGSKEVYPNVPADTCVYTWRSKNPINDLEYGYGGVKLFPKKALINAADWKVDMTTTLGAPFVPMPEVSNITSFNTDPFNTWKSAFRECTKLASSVIPNSDSSVNKQRLDVWCTVGADRDYGKYCVDGANDGRRFGTYYRDDVEALSSINDFEWLKEQFNDKYTNK